jgi:protein O-GlcNAc transferase
MFINRLTAILVVLSLFLAASVRAQDNSQIERLERAAELINKNQLLEAERQLSYVLRVSPRQAVALNLLGTVRAQQGRLNEAERLFSRAIRFENRLVGARMNLAYLYVLKRELAKAALQLNEVLRLEPNNAEANYRLAWVLLGQGRVAECIGLIEKIKQAQPLTVSLLSLLGEAYLKQGDAGASEQIYLQILNDQSANADALLGLASVALIKKNAGTAALYFNRARDFIADSPDLLYKFALVAIDLGLRDDAVSSLQRAIKMRPGEFAYHFVLGTSWLTQPPDLQEAEQAFRAAVKLQPAHSQAQLHLGYVLLKQKKYPEARAVLERSIRTTPSSPESFYYLGLIAQEQNENARAVELFGQAIRLAPSFANAHIALGSTYLKLKDYPRALQELETGVKLKPDDSRAHYNLAILYTRLNNRERAQEEMRIVDKLKSSSVSEKEADNLVPRPF